MIRRLLDRGQQLRRGYFENTLSRTLTEAMPPQKRRLIITVDTIFLCRQRSGVQKEVTHDLRAPALSLSLTFRPEPLRVCYTCRATS